MLTLRTVTRHSADRRWRRLIGFCAEPSAPPGPWQQQPLAGVGGSRRGLVRVELNAQDTSENALFPDMTRRRLPARRLVSGAGEVAELTQVEGQSRRPRG